MAKVLVLGHGRTYLKEQVKPRCAPMDVERWDELVTYNIPKNITFIDYDPMCEPDIVIDVGNEWNNLLPQETYDYVIDAITHVPIKQRKSFNYWNGVWNALCDNGIYIGWNNSSSAYLYPILERRIELEKKDIETYISNFHFKDTKTT